MALSGSIHTNVNSRWRLSIEWSATQDISNNRSTVTSKMYWESLDGYGTIYSTATKYGAVTTDGTTHTFSGSAALSGRQKKLIATQTKTISHSSDGSKTFSLNGHFDAEVTLNNTYYGRVNLPFTYFQLNTIPRASTAAVNANWTAGNNKYVSISRASTSFTHTVRLYVGGTLIKTETGVGYSRTLSFSDDDNRKIFDKINAGASTSTELQIVTYNGGTHIGTTSTTGTVIAPSASTITSFDGEMTKHNNPRDHWTDQTFTFPISRSNTKFTHTIRIHVGGTTIRTLTGVGASVSWTPTAAEKTAMHNKMLSSQVATGGLELTTYFLGEQVRSSASATMYFYIRNAEPTFPAASLTYKDTNATTVAVTGNDTTLIQSISKLSATLTGAATAYAGASISKYDVSINGVTQTSTGIKTFVFGEVSAGGNVSLSVKVTDSRGFTVTVSKTVTVLAYSPPRLTLVAERLGGFEAQTTVEASGSVVPLAGSTNYVKTATAHYKNRKTGATAGTTSLVTSGYPAFTTTPIVYTLDNQTAYDVVVTITDVLSSVTQTVTVEVGRPILFIDSEKGSVGIGDFPIGEGELLLSGRLVFNSTHWASGGQGEGTSGAIDMNNSDIVRANGIYFNDIANNSGEGLLFMKSGRPVGSGSSADYDSFYIRDGVTYMNNSEGLTMPSLHVNSGGDFSNSSVNVGIVVGTSAVTGQRLGIDSNEVQVLNGTTPSTLHLNPDGGLVHVGINSPSAGSRALELNGALQINGNGNNTLDIYADDHAYFQFFIKGSSTRSGYWGWGSGGSNDMSIVNSIGYLRLTGQGASLTVSDGRVYSSTVYGSTYSYPANGYVTSAGTLGRSTSATKYKLNIETVDATDLAERVLYLQPKSWHDKSASEEYAEYLTKVLNNEDVEEFEVPYLERHFGLIAEDLVDLGLEMYVQYGAPDEKGNREVEGIGYDRLWTLLLPTVRNQRDEILSLKDRLETLENIILGGN